MLQYAGDSRAAQLHLDLHQETCRQRVRHFLPSILFFSTSTLSSRWAETPLSGWCPLSTRTPWFSFHRKKSSTRSASTTAAATGSVAKVCFSFFSFFVSTIFLWRCLSLCCWQDWCWLWCLCVRGTLYIEINRTSCLVCLPLSRNCSSLGIFALSSIGKGPREKECFFFRHSPNSPLFPNSGNGKRQKHWHKQHFKAKTT